MPLKFTTSKKVSDPQRLVRYWLHKGSCGSDPPRPISTLHASDTTRSEAEFCPREYALMDQHNKERRAGFLSTALSTTFFMGRTLQDRVAHILSDQGVAICHWRCRNCGTIHEFCKRPVVCGTKGCKSKSFDPIEPRFKSQVSDISCGVDLLVNLKEAKLRLVEVKTMDKEQFKSLAAPLAEHRLRTNLYMRIVDECDLPIKKRVFVDEAIIIYVSKGGFGVKDEAVKTWKIGDHAFSPFKEYRVKRDDSQTEKITQKGVALKLWRKKGGDLPDRVCPTSFCGRAKKCPVTLECFS